MEFNLWVIRITFMLYGIYCIRQQQRLFRNNTIFKYLIVFMVNTVFCPLSLVIAILKKDAYFRPDPNDIEGNKI